VREATSASEVTSADVAAAHPATEVAAAHAPAEMTTAHAPAEVATAAAHTPAAMTTAAATTRQRVGRDGGASQGHGNKDDSDSAQHEFLHGSCLSARDDFHRSSARRSRPAWFSDVAPSYLSSALALRLPDLVATFSGLRRSVPGPCDRTMRNLRKNEPVAAIAAKSRSGRMSNCRVRGAVPRGLTTGTKSPVVPG